MEKVKKFRSRPGDYTAPDTKPYSTGNSSTTAFASNVFNDFAATSRTLSSGSSRSGCALGIDRVAMLAAGAKSIEEVIALPTERARAL